MDPRALLTELIRVPSVNPPGTGEEETAEILRSHLTDAGLDTRIHTSPTGRASLIARLPGRTDRPPLVLLSHTDVVPVEERRWRRHPFGGEVVDGELWGRGALDMKGVAVMHAEAVVALAGSGRTPQREVLVVAVADEEAGGAQGADWLIRELPDEVGFRDGSPPPEVVGEGAFGLTGVTDRAVMPIVLGEKSPLGLVARASGEPAHGSLPSDRQAIRGLARFIEAVSGPATPRIHPVMREQFAALAEASTGAKARLFQLLAGPAGHGAVRLLRPLIHARSAALGHLLSDTVTPTRIRAGYGFNVVPGEAEATLDCRLLPDTDPDELLGRLRSEGVRHRVAVDEHHRWSSPVSPRARLYELIADVSERLPGGPLPVPSLTPGTTDLRLFRAGGATAYGWVPVVLTPELLATFHGNDERIPLQGFDAGLHAMTELVRRATT